MKRWIPLFLLAAAVTPARAQTLARRWPHETSDLPVDRRIRFGCFPNGMRWAWRSNAYPALRCSLRLHVNAGSLAEEDGERGLAHLLEHVAFKGSRRHPPGSLDFWLQRHGMALGADANAHTSFGETVYKLEVPDSRPESLREAFGVLRDFADGLLFDERQIEAEKRIVEAEALERDSGPERARRKAMALGLSGTRFPLRLPIGTAGDRAGLGAAELRRFHEKWYRPENLTLILVGDLGPLDPEPLIRELFGDLPFASGPPPVEPETGRPELRHQVFSVHEQDVPVVTLHVAMVRREREPPPDRAHWKERIPLEYARWMLNKRLYRFASTDTVHRFGGVTSSAGWSLFGAFGTPVLHGERVAITCFADSWRPALIDGAHELRRALQYGFELCEVDEARAAGLKDLDDGVRGERTRSSAELARDLLDAAAGRSVPVSAAHQRELFAPAVQALTAEACHRALAQAWSQGALILYSSGRLDLGEDEAYLLRAAWEESLRRPLEPPETTNLTPFAYASDPRTRGRIQDRSRVPDLDVHELEFENGVRVRIKRTAFESGEILVEARVGDGKLRLAPDQAVLATAASDVFDHCGLGAHRTDELERLTTGREVGVSLSVGEDHVALTGATRPEDLLFQCELTTAWLRDPGWREEGIAHLRKVARERFDEIEQTPREKQLLDFWPAVYGGDKRFLSATRQELYEVSMPEFREWLAPQLARGELDVALVGDLDVEAAVTAAARTFGALPRRPRSRSARAAPDPVRLVGGIRSRHVIETVWPQALVSVVHPVPDGIDPVVRRRLQFLKYVLEDRLRVELREALGATYLPRVGNRMSRVFPGDGFIAVEVLSEPSRADAVAESCLRVADALAREGATTEEVDRLRPALLAGLRDRQRENRFWIDALGDGHGRRGALQELRTQFPQLRSIQAKELTPLARRHLGRDRASVLIVRPEGK
jgi:zinc protease